MTSETDDDDMWAYDVNVHPTPVDEYTVTATIVSVEQGKPKIDIEDLYFEE